MSLKDLTEATVRGALEEYTAEWIDSVTDARMEGFGTEILTVKNGLFNEWIASCSVWRHGDLVKIPGAKH